MKTLKDDDSIQGTSSFPELSLYIVDFRCTTGGHTIQFGSGLGIHPCYSVSITAFLSPSSNIKLSLNNGVLRLVVGHTGQYIQILGLRPCLTYAAWEDTLLARRASLV